MQQLLRRGSEQEQTDASDERNELGSEVQTMSRNAAVYCHTMRHVFAS